jgi:hypothetical protein
MNYAFETIGAFATAPGAAPGTAMAPVAGDSLRIRDSSRAWLLDVITSKQTNDSQTRITSPLIHDNLVGITIRDRSGDDAGAVGKGVLTLPVPQVLTPQDTLQLNAIGSVTAGDVDIVALQIYYEDLAGICGNLIDTAQLFARAEDIFSPRVNITPTASGWSGNIAINALDDQLKANREYAWVGISTAAGSEDWAACVGMVSPDWGNLRIGCPLLINLPTQESYFMMLSDRMKKPCIPVFNASQKQNVILSVLSNENFGVTSISLFLVLLADTAKSKRK